MKKQILSVVLILLVMAMVAGCGKAAKTETIATEPPATVETEASVEVSTEAPAEEDAEVPTEAPAAEDAVPEGNVPSDYVDAAYAEQIGRYYKALSEKWDEGKYFENEMSALPYYYYEGNPLENVGFGYVDLDNNGQNELVIGAILNAAQDPSVFEIWTLVNGEPVMLAQGGSRNRYVLQYVEEDNMWYVVNEASNSAFNSATYYLMLNEGKLEVTQGVVFDASANEQNPWFMTYDMDWDASNDDSIDEATANAILASNRNHYTALEYFPYSIY